LECYDDIQEEMVWSEVEKIAAIITDSFNMRLPSAEITIMGSYRRDKPACGDVDLLITHPDYYDVIPPRCQRFARPRGRISYHLTFILGMNYDNYESLVRSAAMADSKVRIRPPPMDTRTYILLIWV
jgi:hypothetical protein